jgi:hypothetical protein
VGDHFAFGMFCGCSGASFTINGVFNLPQGVTSVGDYFAYGMFSGCSGDSFCMNKVFNLPQGITFVGDYFVSYMFYACYGDSFTINRVFNLPQGVTFVGTGFAREMFSFCYGRLFVVNDVFLFPKLDSTNLNKENVFYRTFYNLGVNSLQRRTATSIIGDNDIPTSNMATFAGSDCFVDRKYIAVNWGGDGYDNNTIDIKMEK